MSNKGIIVSGGQVSAGQMIVGDNASVTVSHQAVPEQLTRCLEDIRALLEGSSLKPAQRAALQEQVKIIEAHAKDSAPDKSLLASALGMIELAAPAVTGLATIILTVKKIVGL
jgi:hypothetical protein